MRRMLVAVTVIATLLLALVPQAISTPVATSEEEYLVYGRVFPDPHGCTAKTGAGSSQFAKGRVCATDFITLAEMRGGLQFLEELYPRFIEFYTLHEDFKCSGEPAKKAKDACKEAMSAGLPVTADESGEGFTRDKQPLQMVRVTDEAVPNKNKDYFVFPVGVHGIERAGVEGGTRAAEDLATWAACEANEELAVCANEQPIPHPIMEATPKGSVTAGDALKKSVVYFVYLNPDGWNRGDRTTGTQFYQRYNGNGVDLNRDWPELGFTFRPYTPWSEPETKYFGRVLQEIGPHDNHGDPKWTGGIDLHGQLVDRAFSFTLVGGSERPYNKNQRILQTMKGAWRDAEGRLAWSPLIKPNDAAEEDPRMYGVQWGTVWDTIAYTVTGAFGDWIDSPIGLNADGLDNEMSMSHLGNCGVGSCFDQDLEQLHVDGNKSLIYSMINYSLKPENTKFRTKGRVAYVHNRGVVKSKAKPLKSPPKYARLPQQKDVSDVSLNTTNEFIYEFDVKGPEQGVYNGGIAIPITCANVQGVSPCALQEALLERKKTDDREPNVQGEGEWEVVNSYFNQSPIYIQAGQALHANLPVPGRYRIRIEGADAASFFTADIDFTKEKAWEDPGQVAYRVTNMNFWKHMKKYMRPGLDKITAKKIATTNRWQRRYETIVITNKVYKNIAGKLRRWVARHDGNLVLTDSALRMLRPMKIIDGKVDATQRYAGYVNFATAKKESTYNHPLAKKINQPGAAEGQGGDEVRRRQTYEPVPLGFAIQDPDGNDANTSPNWFVTADAWKKAKGKQRAVGTTGDVANVSFGETKFRGGRIRIIGALLPMPTDRFDHTFGLADYGLTYAGYQILKNVLKWESPPIVCCPGPTK